MNLSSEQIEHLRIIDEEAENSRWGHLFTKGSQRCEMAENELGKLNLSKPQINNVLIALRTGKFKGDVLAAFDSVMNEHVDDNKNTHR